MNPLLSSDSHTAHPAFLARRRLDVTTDAKNFNNQFLSTSQLIDRTQGWKRQARRAQLEAFNLRKKAAVLVKNLTIDKRILLLMSQENIPGVRRVLAAALKRGSSNHAILEPHMEIPEAATAPAPAPAPRPQLRE